MSDVDMVRAEPLDWLGANWDPGLSLLEWRRRLAESGWAAPTWPARWGGRGLPASAADVVTSTLAEFGSVGPTEGFGMTLAAPTLPEHGSGALKGRFLPPAASGEISWCQLFSEPGAGGVIAEILLSVPAVPIAGGTDEIQRKIIGERVLGLPEEPSVDTTVPFRDVPRNRS